MYEDTCSPYHAHKAFRTLAIWHRRKSELFSHNSLSLSQVRLNFFFMILKNNLDAQHSFWKLFILFEKQSQRVISHLRVYSSNAHNGLHWASQELWARSSTTSQTLVARTQVLQLLPVASQGAHWQEAGIGSRQSLKPGILLWSRSSTNGVLTTAPNTHPLSQV